MAGNSLPFEPRVLTKSERRRGDLHVFNSPKLGRRVELIECVRMALALRFEFDPPTLAYVERPRTLEVQGEPMELDFWTREPRGRERFWLVVAIDDTLSPRSPRREYRRARELVEAAQRAQLSLEFCFEEDLQRDAGALGTWYRLLPYAQTALTLPNREALRTQVLAQFDTLARASFDQVENALRGFHAADVRAIAVDLVCDGQLALVDPAHLTRFSVLERRNAHGQA
jgi:hypothetical protein